MDYPLHLTSQLREHLRALRKARGLTQAALGQMLGVGQARVAEIEGNPGAVSVDQLMKVLSALHATLVVRDTPEVIADQPDTLPQPHTAPANEPRRPARQSPVNIPPVGQWRKQPLADVTPTSMRNFVIRPKKGSW